MQTFEVIIPEFSDQSFIEASTPRRAVYLRLHDLDKRDLAEFDSLEIIVHDEVGLKTIFHVTPGRFFRCQKVS